MAYKNTEPNRKLIILLAVFISIILYLSGVFSGLYANKILEQKTKKDIETIKVQTESNIAVLKAETLGNVELMQKYVVYLESSLRSIQLDQIFLESLDKSQRCNFSSITMDNLLSDLSFYWSNLPFRIEAYEKTHNLSQDYLQLKKQYIQLSIRAWIIAKNKYSECNTDIVPILYFYSKDCENCIEQGEELDKVQQIKWSNDIKVIVFTVDFDSDELMIKNLLTYYKINSTPALVINNEVLAGNLTKSMEIINVIAKS